MTVLNYHLDREAMEARDPEDLVVIMRPSRWGNPIRLGMVIDGRKIGRGDAILHHRRHLAGEIFSGRLPLGDLAALHGKDLVCCCAPRPCHGHVLERAAAWAHGMLQRPEKLARFNAFVERRAGAEPAAPAP